MISQILKTTFLSLGIGFIVELINSWLATTFLPSFFEANLVTILVALLAVNAATMGIVLTKIRELIEKNGNSKLFEKTRSQMLLSVKEQIALIIFSAVILSAKTSPLIISISNMNLLLNSIVNGIFAYALFILYDTAKGVLIIIDFDG